jgi:hypothetical protein
MRRGSAVLGLDGEDADQAGCGGMRPAASKAAANAVLLLALGADVDGMVGLPARAIGRGRSGRCWSNRQRS